MCLFLSVFICLSISFLFGVHSFLFIDVLLPSFFSLSSLSFFLYPSSNTQYMNPVATDNNTAFYSWTSRKKIFKDQSHISEKRQGFRFFSSFFLFFFFASSHVPVPCFFRLRKSERLRISVTCWRLQETTSEKR